MSLNEPNPAQGPGAGTVADDVGALEVLEVVEVVKVVTELLVMELLVMELLVTELLVDVGRGLLPVSRWRVTALPPMIGEAARTRPAVLTPAATLGAENTRG